MSAAHTPTLSEVAEDVARELDYIAEYHGRTLLGRKAGELALRLSLAICPPAKQAIAAAREQSR